MKKKIGVFSCLLAILFIAGFLIGGKSETSIPEPVIKESVCLKLKGKDCAIQQKRTAPAEMLIESLSRQFLSFSPVLY